MKTIIVGGVAGGADIAFIIDEGAGYVFRVQRINLDSKAPFMVVDHTL